MSWLFGSDNNNPSDSHLNPHNTRASRQPLLPPLGSTHPKSPIPGVGRGNRSPRTPSPLVTGERFVFPTTSSTSTASAAASSVNCERRVEPDFSDFEEDFDGEMALSPDAQAVLAAAQALTAASTSISSKKKPDLPAFDKRHVEIWIKRVEAAFIRSGVTQPQDKFAHLEAKFPVDYNPKINEFLFGDPTAERWTAFIEYLKREYGQTKRQQANTILSPFPRSGARPSQQLASLIEKTNLLTIDDIRKEIIFKGLPADVRHSIVDKLEGMSAAETAELADKYFDREGNPLSASASVNAIEDDEQQQFEESDDDDADINAVGKYKGIGRRFGDFNNTGQKSRSGSNNHSNFRRGNANSNHSNNNSSKPSKLCFAHDKFGDKAYNCKATCPRYAEFVAKNPSKAKSGNGTASKRA